MPHLWAWCPGDSSIGGRGLRRMTLSEISPRRRRLIRTSRDTWPSRIAAWYFGFCCWSYIFFFFVCLFVVFFLLEEKHLQAPPPPVGHERSEEVPESVPPCERGQRL